MPRGVKGSGKPRSVKSIDERIAEVDLIIDSLQEKLADAKSKRKELLKTKEKTDFHAIQKIIQESGMSPEQLKILLESKK